MSIQLHCDLLVIETGSTSEPSGPRQAAAAAAKSCEAIRTKAEEFIDSSKLPNAEEGVIIFTKHIVHYRSSDTSIFPELKEIFVEMDNWTSYLSFALTEYLVP